MSKKCKCCGNNKLQILIDFGMQPVAHNLLDSEEEKNEFKHPLCLHYCENCGFIQINNPIDPEQLYTKYNYCFGAWKKQPHISAEIELLNKHIKDKNINILEIGCNDGVFLDPLYKAGYKKITGIEANPYAAKDAMAHGFDIINAMFDKNSSKDIKEKYGSFDMIVMRQVLEHIPDLEEFFEALDLILGEEKLLFIEIPNFEEALKYGDCSTIWEEHPNYFTYDVLEFMLNMKGYIVVAKDFYDYSGGAMCVLARKRKSSIRYVKRDMLQYNNFAKLVNDYASKLKYELKNARERGSKILLYGTGSRACTLVNGLGVGELIDYAIDDQKEKQGHFMPGSHLPIISLDKANKIEQGKKIFLLAVNHESEEVVSEKILLLNNKEENKIVSLFAPNNIFKELEKIND